MLALRDVEVSYGRTPAVRGISLRVERGEIVGIVGPNGAGKSTTMAACAGLLKPRRGAVELDGRSVVGVAPERIARRGLSFVPEGRLIFTRLTVRENLELGLTARRSPAAGAVERELERFPALRRYYDSHAGGLSGGEQQQLAIARALVADPEILLLDEPSLGLAPKMVDLVFEVLAGLREQGVTVLLVEQNARRTVRLADRSYVLVGGLIRAEGTAEALLGSEEIESLYLGVG